MTEICSLRTGNALIDDIREELSPTLFKAILHRFVFSSLDVGKDLVRCPLSDATSFSGH
jgi:hypothetical protein